VDYRCTPAFQDLVTSKFAFNDHILMRTHEVLKEAMDPNGIISPGRYGLWPKQYRNRRTRA
jgi:4-cresol dehydrogenase (hydroxylating)